MSYFRFVAEDVRGDSRSSACAASMSWSVAATCCARPKAAPPVQRQLDLSRLLAPRRSGRRRGQRAARCRATRCATRRRWPTRIAARCRAAIELGSGGTFRYAIANTDRAIGARLSGDVARRWGDHGMPERRSPLQLDGSAGQSLGAWNAGGVQIVLDGEANDGVGKGMAGGRIVVRPPPESPFASAATRSILGNTCLYGATGGELFAAGRAGERFGVRNSGALAVSKAPATTAANT